MTKPRPTPSALVEEILALQAALEPFARLLETAQWECDLALACGHEYPMGDDDTVPVRIGLLRRAAEVLKERKL